MKRFLSPNLLLLACACTNGVDASRSEPAEALDGRRAERLRMVAEQIEADGISDPAVLDAMRRVPRHWFVPDGQSADAYDDRPLPIGAGQTISQPLIVAMMTEALALSAESRVLEIGTGSGYQGAVLSEITPHVFTIEIVPELAARAKELFDQHGYDTIRCRTGDGYAGWPEEAPFDAIVVTAAPGSVPPALFEQLARGGRMCIPVGDSPYNQELLLVTKNMDGTRSERELGAVSFVPFTRER